MPKLTKAEMTILARPELQPATRRFAESVRASREHSSLAAKALKQYGDHGSNISGVVRDHFPDKVKDKLRALARSVTAYSDAGYKERPKGVRDSTMRKLAQAVATRDGSGFYGAQGRRKNPPTRGKRKVKKKRSAKQLANDRRLGKMAKARAKAKKRGTNPRRKSSKERHWSIGKRVELPAWSDQWMRGDRYGEVIGVARKAVASSAGPRYPLRVQLDKSNKVIRVFEEDLSFL